MSTETAIEVPRLISIDGLGDLFEALVAGGYPVASPNLAALTAQLRRLGMTSGAVDRVLATFNVASPALASARRG